MAAWAAFLSRFPAGSHVSFSYTPQPQSVALDLAVQAAGLIAVPQKGLQGQQGLQGPGVEIAGEAVVLPAWDEAERAAASEPAPERLARGGAVVHGAAGEAVLLQDDLVAAAERFGREIPELSAGRRHVVVLAGFAGDPAERALLSWVTLAGAAVLLEPEPLHLVPAAVWARPTLFAGSAADLVRLRAAVKRDEAGFKLFGHRPRLPFGRLRAVLVTAGGMPPEEQAFWEERGVFAAERQERGI